MNNVHINELGRIALEENRGSVAQWMEHRTANAEVEGSIPSRPATFRLNEKNFENRCTIRLTVGSLLYHQRSC